jgi:hypothetical protein
MVIFLGLLSKCYIIFKINILSKKKMERFIIFTFNYLSLDLNVSDDSLTVCSVFISANGTIYL